LINQFATPGLGSLLVRRIVSGTLQLLLAVAGFVLLVYWIVHFFYNMAMKQADEPISPGNFGWTGAWGALLFAGSWIWSLFTSISVLRQARRAEESQNLPPILT